MAELNTIVSQLAFSGAAVDLAYTDTHTAGETNGQDIIDLLVDPSDDKTTAAEQTLLNIVKLSMTLANAAPVDGELVALPGAHIPTAMTLVSVTHKTTSGTVTVAVKKNGTDLSGLSALAADSSSTTTNATGTGSDNVLAEDDRLRFVLSSASTPVDLNLVLKFTRAVGS